MSVTTVPDVFSDPNIGNAPYSVRRHTLSPRPKIRVVILDDHPATVLGLASYLRTLTDLDVRWAETRADQLNNFLRQHPCDVAVVDFYLPGQQSDGPNLIRRLKRLYPGMAVIVCSAGRQDETEFAAFQAGANAYLPKLAPVEFLPELIRRTSADKHTFVGWKNGRSLAANPVHPEDRLTRAELEILRQISQSQSVTQVAKRLSRSKKTVSTHKRRAMKKLGLPDDLALALYLKEKFQRDVY
ncbi:DNA-binding response regulator [Bordetella genomosp. 1]|nr:response regulator transcription factor [Bordetella genomosp. 1]MDQ8034980.1 response regulator transcription factor [Bordetella sp.]OZI36256.1 DNA-binding response regulator [Bordetella genomosp. 1]